MDTDITIILKSSDGKIVEISKKSASKSELLNGMFSDFPDNTEFPLNQVNGDILSKIKDYLEHYKDEEPQKIDLPLKSLDFKQCVSEWDYNFLGENNDILFDLVDASNYMDIKPLFELSSAKLGSKIKGMTSEKIKTDFEIPPLTEEEKDQIVNLKKYLEDNF